jgi:hypothetical protein
MFNVKSITGSAKVLSVLDLPSAAVIPVAISPVIDAGGFGGGETAPHSISPEKAEKASAKVRTAAAQH